MADYVLLDTKAFDTFLNQKEDFLQRYNQINTTYEEIVDTLLDNWVGDGASAFQSDADNVKKNITGIYDILKTMCDVLEDCQEVFSQCDTSLGEYNQNPTG